MALSISTGTRDFVAVYGSYKRALAKGVFKLYGGTVPATADAAASATLLCTVSLASGAVTSEICSAGSVTYASSGGSVDTLTVDSKEIMGAAVSYVSDLTTTAAAVAAQVNSYQTAVGAEYIATSIGAKVIITALPGTGTGPNTLTVAGSTTTLTTTYVAMGTEVAGVANVNGLTYGGVSAGVLSKSGTWSGVNASSGTATHFRVLGSVADAGGASTSAVRIQGTCGVTGADYNMSSTTLTSGATHTVDTFTITLPAA